MVSFLTLGIAVLVIAMPFWLYWRFEHMKADTHRSFSKWISKNHYMWWLGGFEYFIMILTVLSIVIGVAYIVGLIIE